MKINEQENPQYTKFEKILMTQKCNDSKNLMTQKFNYSKILMTQKFNDSEHYKLFHIVLIKYQ